MAPPKADGNKNYTGIPQNFAENEQRMQLIGLQDHLDASPASADFDVPESFQNCRAIMVDTTGILKVDHVTDYDGSTKTLIFTANAGVHFPLRNVKKVYQYYTGTTPITAEIYDSTGTSVVGVHLFR